MKKHLQTIWPSIIWAAIIFILLTMPTGSVNDSGLMDVVGIDKIIHFSLFFVLTFLVVIYISHRVGYRKTKSLVWYIVLFATCYGLGMEFYQKNFTERSFSLLDAFFDGLGSIAGMFWAKKSPYGNRGRNQN